jgi:hypothetical protein
MTIIFAFFFLHSRSNRRSISTDSIQEVQTPSPPTTPQERHTPRNLANAHAGKLYHPRIPLLCVARDKHHDSLPEPNSRGESITKLKYIVSTPVPHLCGRSIPPISAYAYARSGENKTRKGSQKTYNTICTETIVIIRRSHFW